ncbi:hypothetical protein OG909_07875 [Streptomyces sp. NBC_01754]|uniref:hypothetical protein n=1 Tax=Streptomyces sp. NBC_01754 TaxID=2975930 RepID=UPI002DDC1FD8|nr:hypothetical protein [Streptomyces sp. NBC_01754]WSC92219.1 hypothetical protein OG909_07875 [Streptomyces sp. NBC_01754]
MVPGITPPNSSEPPPVPARGTLVVDTGRDDRVGEFRGVAGPYWSLRPIRGGAEWEVDPAHVRLADAKERLHAETARANARSRGAVL